jgi:acyl-CoA synthetase (AMP-forming)/AMP-acid ligase II
MNIIDPILFHSRHDPEALALCAPGVDLVTYERLHKSINNVARRASALGLKPGQIVALFLPQRPIIHAVLVLGLARLGVVTASLGTRSLPKSLRVDTVVSDGPYSDPASKTIQLDPSWLTGDGTPPAIDAPKADDLCRIILTSGTTGEPKAVGLTHRMILERVLRFHALCGNKLPFGPRLLCDVTLATSLGYTMFVATLIKGGAFFVRGNNAENTLRALGFYNVNAFVVAPGSLPELLAEYDKHRCRHAFDVILTGGSILSNRLAESVGTRMGSNVVAAYGSAEASLVASAPAHAIRDTAGAVGYVTPGMRVEIVDDSDRPVPPGKSGIVRIRGDHVVSGYFNEMQSPSQIFRDGWFYPGDIGSLTAEGMLVISGRHKAVLNLGGEKIAPEAIEEAVAACGSAIPAGAAVVTNSSGLDEIWVAIESQKPIDRERLHEYCRENLPDKFVPKRFITVACLPRNAMGKLDRARLRQMLEAEAAAAEPPDVGR